MLYNKSDFKSASYSPFDKPLSAISENNEFISLFNKAVIR